MGKAWRWAGAGLFVAVTAFAAPPEAPPDLTGTWKGEMVCDSFDGTRYKEAYRHDTMYISRDGDRMRMRATCDGGALPGDFDTCQVDYEGFALAADKDPDRKSEATFNACTTGDWFLYNEVLRADKLEFRKGADAAFEGDSIYSYFSRGNPDARFFANCKWKYRRLTTVDPEVPECRVRTRSAAPAALSAAAIAGDASPRKLP
jgi:hypothetical protein